MNCFSCGAAIDTGRRVDFRAECPSCGVDTHVCLNCVHYDPGSHNMCREPQAEWVKDREKSNRCEYFRPSMAPGRPSSRVSDARAKLDSLFKKDPDGQ
jgi:hypothetical protein